jgi:very-long-chain (3R)-3-hydroxyacyl-CoA dehydratase
VAIAAGPRWRGYVSAGDGTDVLMVILILILTIQTHKNPLFTTMLLAWSVTEVIRYPFYVLNLLGTEWYPLNWLRYNTFLVLYPLGAGSEAFLSYSTLPPLSTLPYAPRVIVALHSLIHHLPASVSQKLLSTAPGRSLLWAVARAKVSPGSKLVTWTPIQYARLVLFFVWWPGG